MTLYSFSHLLQPWILPPGINILLIAAGFMLAWRCHCLGKLLMLMGFFSLWLLSTPIVAYNFIDLLQKQYPLLPPTAISAQHGEDVIIVLGGGDIVVKEYGQKRIVSDFTRHRLDYAIYLQQKTHLPIIVSGGRTLAVLDSEATLMENYLQGRGVKKIIQEDSSLTTADESRSIAGLLKRYHFHHPYLVTNAWHMPRSVYIFKRAGILVTPAPMGYFLYGPGYALISFFPSVEALHASALALHEFIGLVWYHARYGSGKLPPTSNDSRG